MGCGQWWVQAGSPEQSWGSQSDGMMQDHVPWGQKGAINAEKGGSDGAQCLGFVGRRDLQSLAAPQSSWEVPVGGDVMWGA